MGDSMKIVDKIKEYIKNNKQKVTLFGSVAFVMLLIIVAIAVVVKIVGFRISYEELESRLEKATYSYLQDNSNLLPSVTNPTMVVDANTLVENKYIKNIQKLVKDNSCTANVIVDYVNNDYKYQAYVTCKGFKTEKFVDTIKTNNKISQVGEGLYEMNNELVFRGQNPKNYVKFAGHVWRIVKINQEGNINIIVTDEKAENYGSWDNRYNTDQDAQRGINNFLLSRAFSGIKNYYDSNIKKYEKYLASYDLCVGKRLQSSVEKNGSLECSELIESQYIGLLPVSDYLNASLDGLCQTTTSKECQNYNYLATYNVKWWTMTANMKNTASVFLVNAKGYIESDYASSSNDRRYVVTLSSDVLYKSGNGTKDDPFVIR